MTESPVLTCRRMAHKERQPAAKLIRHTDRGGQFDGNEYRFVLERTHLRDSMSRADNCYDNAFMETRIGTIKKEVDMTRYK